MYRIKLSFHSFYLNFYETFISQLEVFKQLTRSKGSIVHFRFSQVSQSVYKSKVIKSKKSYYWTVTFKVNKERLNTVLPLSEENSLEIRKKKFSEFYVQFVWGKNPSEIIPFQFKKVFFYFWLIQFNFKKPNSNEIHLS